MSETSNPSPFAVIVNGEKKIEYFRDRALTQKQENDLLALDEKLNRGFHVDGKQIQSPSVQDKAVFISNLIANAIQRDEDHSIAMACAYLATRNPELKQLKITAHNDRVSLELINNQVYGESIPIKFVPRDKLG